jgi:hypothetical protein
MARDSVSQPVAVEADIGDDEDTNGVLQDDLLPKRRTRASAAGNQPPNQRRGLEHRPNGAGWPVTVSCQPGVIPRRSVRGDSLHNERFLRSTTWQSIVDRPTIRQSVTCRISVLSVTIS